jgi:hypothetical protein
MIETMIRCCLATIASAGRVPSPFAGEGGSACQQQDRVRGTARSLIQTCRFRRRRCLLPQREKARSWPPNRTMIRTMIGCCLATIASAGRAPSPLAGEGGSACQQQDRVRGAARPLIRTCRFGCRRCLLPRGEKARSSPPSHTMIRTMIRCLATIASAGRVPSPLAGEGGSACQQQDRVRGAARPLIRTCRFGCRRCLLPHGEKARS